ncbi:MAG: ribosome small subunit-dependent GTPase A, partial [Gammaproteobacteria bacterium RBG_16_57_12]
QHLDRVTPVLPELEQASAADQAHGLIIANYGATLDVEAADGRIYRCRLRSNLEEIVCGDRVAWQKQTADSGVVVALAPRDSLLCRPDFQQNMKPIAANIDQIIVTAAVQPELSTALIDRYLVAAEHGGIRPIIVINKIDLLPADELARLKERLRLYADIGYAVIYASVRLSHGLDALRDCLADRTSIFAGHSGVGKSSLIKSLLPEQDIRIGEVSEVTGKGMHTTTRTVLYHLPCGGNLIDSPGIREFGLWGISPEQVDQGFVEFRPYLGQCRFRNCRHLAEPGCAIQQ